MLLAWLYFLALTTLVASTANSVFTNSFLVRFHRSVQNDVVHDIASRNGFENVGEVISNYIHSFLFTLMCGDSAPKGCATNRKEIKAIDKLSERAAHLCNGILISF